MALRNGVDELFMTTIQCDIPIVIKSGGIYEVIEHTLQYVVPKYQNL